MSDETADTTEVVQFDDIAEAIQDAQDVIEAVEEDIPASALAALEAVEEDVEDLEDALEHGEGSLPDGIEEDVQATQDDIDDLQETLATGGADPDLFRKVEDLEDKIETIEDDTVSARDKYGVKVDGEPVEFFDEVTPTAETILARFGKNTDDALVEAGTENTYSGDDEVDLSDPGVERFTSEPRTPGNA